MKKHLTLLILSFWGFLHAFSQTAPQVIPPSPKTAEYNKYIEYKVSLYNGLPEISIPLYEIKVKGLTIPISLNYHASGIKYKQYDGDVGVGWTLSPGYRVSRTIYGFPDEKFDKPSYIGDSLSHYQHDPLKRDKFLSRFLEPDFESRPSTAITSALDGEYDIFNFSTPLEAGSFLISDRANKTVTPIQSNRNKTIYRTGNSDVVNGIIGFNIIDDSGNRFSYGDFAPLGTNKVFETTSAYGTSATAWALTEAFSPLGGKISFNYNYRNAGTQGYSKNFIISEQTPGGAAVGELPIPSTTNYEELASSSGNYTSFFLDEISSDYETIEIDRSIDTHGDLVRKMEIRDKENVLIKKIEFYYSYSGHNLLDSIKIYDNQAASSQIYSFSYYKPSLFSGEILVPDQWGYPIPADNIHQLFHKEFADDMVRLGEGGLPLQFIKSRAGEVLPGTIVRNDINYVQNQYSLHTITYPTGGKTTYEYEPHQYKFTTDSIVTGGGIRIKKISSNDLKNETLVKRYAYGIQEDGSGNPTVALMPFFFASENISFRYSNNGTYFIPQRILNYSTSAQGDVDPGGFIASYVTYPAVTEYIEGKDELQKIEYKFDLGTRYSLLSYPISVNHGMPLFPDLEYFDYSPMFVSMYRTWDVPKLIEKSNYIKVGNQYNALNREKYKYIFYSNEFQGLKVKPFGRSVDYNPLHSANYYSNISSFFKFGTYTIHAGNSLLSEKEEITYNGSDSLLVKTTNRYNNLDQLISQTVDNNSKGEELKTTYKYPQEVVSNPRSPADAFLTPYSFLVENNMINAPVETVSSVRKGDIEYITAVSVNKYKGVELVLNGTSLKTVLPKAQYYFDNEQPLLKSSYVPFSSQVISFQEANNIDNNLEERLRYDFYDQSGNLGQYTLSGNSVMSYKWAYNGRYPVAEVKNATSHEFYYQDFEDIGNNIVAHTGNKGFTGTFSLPFTTPNSKTYLVSWWSYHESEWQYNREVYSNQSLNGHLDDICIFPQDALISTYTFQPFAGIKSSTDPKGHVTYYDYDNFQRLKYIRNDKKSILKEFSYHYGNRNNGLYYNEETIHHIKKNNCDINYTAGPMVRYVVGAGTYTSNVSQEDANNKAYQDYVLNGQAYANANGSCLKLYYNTAVQVSLIRNNCIPHNPSGTPVTYTVPAAKYTSTISQQDADARAQEDLNINGQSYANAHGSCAIYYNVGKSAYFIKNNCPTGSNGTGVWYIVPSNTYSSTISQQDADAKAQTDLTTNGQNYANNNGDCIPLVTLTLSRMMYSGNIQRISLHNTGTTESISFFPVNNGYGDTFQVPAGNYSIQVELTEDDTGEFYINYTSNNGSPSSCFKISNTIIAFPNVSISGSSNQINIGDYCF